MNMMCCESEGRCFEEGCESCCYCGKVIDRTPESEPAQTTEHVLMVHQETAHVMGEVYEVSAVALSDETMSQLREVQARMSADQHGAAVSFEEVIRALIENLNRPGGAEPTKGRGGTRPPG